MKKSARNLIKKPITPLAKILSTNFKKIKLINYLSNQYEANQSFISN